jgi:uncharacterized membrane protein
MVKTSFDMESVIGYVLLTGVLLSITLTLAGLIWNWIGTGDLGLDYPLSGMNFFQFLLTNLHQLVSSDVRPRLLVNLGIAVLLFTPYLRVFVSIIFFALVERNWKYTLFTCFVFSVLTYSLFLR